MTMRVLAGAALLTVLAVSASVATAEVYKSVDENGRVVFSQKPPQGTKSEVIKPRYSKPPTAPAGGPAPFVPPAQPGGMPNATGDAGKAKELTPEQKEAKQKNCETARERLAQLQGPRSNRLQYTNDQGERAYFTPEDLEKHITDAQAKIAENCAGDATEASAP
jgi:hypothetical protein